MKSGLNAEKAATGKHILRHPALHALLIAALALLCYANTFHSPFILDDGNSIVGNPVIRDLGAFLGGAGFHYNPRRFIGYLTFALNYRLGGLDPVGYHAVNFAIHTLAALSVYALVRVTFRSPLLRESALAPRAALVALTAALLFAVHPVQTQAVTYVVQRFASLATLFYLLSLLFYAKGRVSRFTDPGSRFTAFLFYAASALAALLGAMTKEIVATLPLAVLLYELCFFHHGRKRRLLFLTPFAAAAATAPLVLMGQQGPLGRLFPGLLRMAQESAHVPRLDYFYTQFRVIVTYLRLLVLPVDQNLDYQYPIYSRFFTPPVLLSALFLAALFGLAVYLYFKGEVQGLPGHSRKTTAGSRFKVQGSKPEVSNSKFKTQNSKLNTHESPSEPPPSSLSPELRLIAFGILWFFLTISVTSSVISIADVIFEHRLYLPSVGAFIAFSAFVFMVGRRLSPRVAGTALVAVIVVLSSATFNRNRVWADPIALWSDVVAKSPAKERGYCNLGYQLLEKGRVEEALKNLYTARMLNPDYAKTYLNLGVALGRKGRLEEARQNFEIAIAKDPTLELAHFDLGVIYAMRGRMNRAVAHMETAVRLAPGDAIARKKLSDYRRMAGQ